jgi:hypothetical protein
MLKLQGTRTYWKPSASGAGATPRQILKNAGYVSIVLQGVQYKANGTFWQQTFGGSDKITVSTQVTWQASGDSNKVAAAIQDFRKVSVPSVNALAIGRNIVLKVPAVANGVEMQVNLTAIRDDGLGKTLQMLNSDDFKQPLQLAPVAIGQVLMIANMVKKVFTDVDPAQMLSASYPGIISDAAIADPVLNNRLVEGYIIVIVKQDDEDTLDFDTARLSVTGNGLLYDGKAISNTYMVYNITLDPWRGRDTGSSWSKKFDQASNKADELVFATPDQSQGIIAAAFDLLKEGGALLADDDSYIRDEKSRLRKAAFQEVQDKIAANTKPAPATPMPAAVRAPKDEPEPNTPDDREEVMDYAEQLAAAGLPFGFSFLAQR